MSTARGGDRESQVRRRESQVRRRESQVRRRESQVRRHDPPVIPTKRTAIRTLAW
ncbi:hypothetical protein RCF27_16060 [Rhodococcus pyridinivorans]|uniref:Uncharacterized protein n=1 Tax=Rhodococcus pyridinivorans TaxID=103816 RepID=A0A7M2XI88_9NOCA|nr:hypothetical protein [Rhodococcus pyridinivorans]QOV97484.1 hypothetical protein INP59_16265 [Rhodococcus pyridinivorans]WMM71394.1 hypothetical protein RCF27_16060 [Rhodococcus pyridinivorans]